LWNGIPNGGTTDAAFAVTSIGGRLYLFAKGIDDRQLYCGTPAEWLDEPF
jgi:hypothetical protein